MFAAISFALFVVAFIFVGAGVVVHSAWLAVPALTLAGFAFLALDRVPTDTVGGWRDRFRR